MAYCEVTHKYLLKALYRRTNKKEYELQILEHNIRHTNVIAMQNAILIAKLIIMSAKKNELNVDMPNTEVTRLCSATNFLLKYNWHLNLIDNKAVINLGLQSIKKYYRRAAHVADELSHLSHFLLALTVFINEAYSNYE